MTKKETKKFIDFLQKSAKNPARYARKLHQAVAILLIEVDGLTRSLNQKPGLTLQPGEKLEGLMMDPDPCVVKVYG